MAREALHDLIDRIPEAGLPAAKRFLEYLASSVAFAAPPDDEPITKGDVEAIVRARNDIEGGRVVSHEDILREFGVR